jgi:hypothetical protein
VKMMELERMETVPSFDIKNIMFSPKLEHSFDDAQAKTKTSTFRNELTSSFGIDAARVVELDLYEDDSEEDEGEVMLLAMILLQLHGVKFPGGFPEDQDQNNKKKRQRTSPDQLAILETIFQTDKMPSQQTRVQLADQLGMSSRRVQIWFQNKRAKVKRGSLGKSSDGVPQPDSPQLDIEREGMSLSSSSCLSEPSSPLVPESFNGSPSLPSFSSSSPALSLSNMPPSPSSAVVPCSPSLPQTPRQFTSQAAQLQFSLSNLAQPIFSSEFSTMSSLGRPQGV